MFSANPATHEPSRKDSRQALCAEGPTSSHLQSLLDDRVDISGLSKASLFSRPEQGLVTLQGNCLELMSRIKDKSVDMIFCDLPYGTTRNAWDSVLPLDLLWAQYERIIKDNGAIVLTPSLIRLGGKAYSLPLRLTTLSRRCFARSPG